VRRDVLCVRFRPLTQLPHPHGVRPALARVVLRTLKREFGTAVGCKLEGSQNPTSGRPRVQYSHLGSGRFFGQLFERFRAVNTSVRRSADLCMAANPLSSNPAAKTASAGNPRRKGMENVDFSFMTVSPAGRGPASYPRPVSRIAKPRA
jgi:hypothetical protein